MENVFQLALLMALFFMAAQLIMLVNPLLYSSYMYPTIVDRLFIEKLPRLVDVRTLLIYNSFKITSNSCNFKHSHWDCLVHLVAFLLLFYSYFLLILSCSVKMSFVRENMTSINAEEEGQLPNAVGSPGILFREGECGGKVAGTEL